MPQYFFTATSTKGESHSGTMEAKNTQELASLLRQEGYLLIKAEPVGGKSKKLKNLDISLPFFNKVSLKEKMFFTRNLQVMISSGLSLPRSLKTLSAQAKSKKFKKAIDDIREQVVKGSSFSKALSSYPDIFSSLYQNMIKVAEETGNLEEVLSVLTLQMERESDLKSKIMGAMLYPAVIILAMVGIGALMLIMVIPRLAETFDELGVELPATTSFVISLGNFMAEKWYWLILIIIAFYLLARFALKTEPGKKFLDSFLLRLPIISPIVKKINAAQTTRTLSSLTSAGVPIVRALEIVSGSLGNIYFKQAMLQASEEVKKGGKLSEAIKPYQNLYPLLVYQMMEVGEETGETSVVLTKLADFFEDEVGRTTKNLSSVIEPILILFVGAVVGFFAVSMIQPMYSMLGTL